MKSKTDTSGRFAVHPPSGANRKAMGNDSRRFPWEKLHRGSMPGYWLLASLGKRVLRPGGIGLTRVMMEKLAIGETDHVIEYAPGMGVSAMMALEKNPAGYTGIERDGAAARLLHEKMGSVPGRVCLQADATDPLPFADESVTVVFGESMLTIHPEEDKNRILGEVRRVLRPGGRFGMQEISLIPEITPPELGERIRRELIRAVHHPAQPNTTGRWKEILQSHGFEILFEQRRPVMLLELDRLIEDEGTDGALRFAWNTLDDPVAVERVRRIRAVFERYRDHLCGYCLVCRKKTPQNGPS